MKDTTTIALFTLLILSGICLPLSQVSAQPNTYTYYFDGDGDGYGKTNSPITIEDTTPPPGYAAQGGDCDDSNAAIHPGATEICGNGLDNNCNGQVDEGCPCFAYFDGDGDGYGTTNSAVEVPCGSGIPGYVGQGGDCNDANAAVHPGATEVCGNGLDDNCDGQVDVDCPCLVYFDGDGDGYGTTSSAVEVPCDMGIPGYVGQGGDCNDANAAVHPGATEVCGNFVDDNCDGQMDEGCHCFVYFDGDGDGYGTTNSAVEVPCSTGIPGYVGQGGDCNDANTAVHPGAKEICGNGIDENCDGKLDVGCPCFVYFDGDGDGYGTTSSAVEVPCDMGIPGYVGQGGDCNDANTAVHPGATEVCDGLDNNCNGQIDEGVSAVTYYRDKDGDGYGNSAATTTANCSAAIPKGYVNNNIDCNDNKASVHPEAVEVCGNGIDDNCNGQVDEGCSTPVTISINDVSVYESKGAAVLTVSLSNTNAQAVQVKYSTSKGTATAGKDYTNAKGTVIIPAGSLSNTISVPVLQDNVNEQAEYFDVQLTQPVNATLSDAVGRATILNGAALVLTSADVSHLSLRVDKEPATGGLLVKALPNPSTNRFTLLTQSDALETLQIRVLNNLGQMVESRHGIAANSTLHLGVQYRPGVYFVEITQGKQRQVLKLIKQ